MNHHRDHTLKPNAVKSRIYKGSGTRWRRRRDIPGALDDRMLISRLGNLRNPDPTYCQQASKCTAESKHGKLLIYLPSSLTSYGSNANQCYQNKRSRQHRTAILHIISISQTDLFHIHPSDLTPLGIFSSQITCFCFIKKLKFEKKKLNRAKKETQKRSSKQSDWNSSTSRLHFSIFNPSQTFHQIRKCLILFSKTKISRRSHYPGS